MRDPMIASDGFTYEKASIERWIARAVHAGRHPVSPLTDEPLANFEFKPNTNMMLQVGYG